MLLDMHVKGGGQRVGVSSVLSPFGSQRSNSGPPAWQPVPLCTEPSPCPCLFIYEQTLKIRLLTLLIH